MERRKGNKERK